MAIDMIRMLRGMIGELRWAPANRRVRASVDGYTVADSRDVRVVWEPRRPVAQYAVPVADLAGDLVDPMRLTGDETQPAVLPPRVPFRVHSTPGTSWSLRLPTGAVIDEAAFTPADPDLADWVILDWHAFDEWTEEDQVVYAHPHDPFHRIDCLTSTRHVVVRLGDTVLADTRRPVLLQETNLQNRWYIPRDDVRMELLAPSDTSTACAYKGTASYWSAELDDLTVEDAAWSYDDPLHDGVPIGGMLCFYDDRVTVEVD